jgi:hypothetical protein
MKKMLLLLALILPASLSAQLSVGNGGSVNLSTTGGGMIFPGANTIGVANSGDTGWRTPLYGDITALWASGSCTGYLYSDGTCSSPGGERR